jgi:hypothetical protein
VARYFDYINMTKTRSEAALQEYLDELLLVATPTWSTSRLEEWVAGYLETFASEPFGRRQPCSSHRA